MPGELSRSILRRRFVAALIQGSEHAALDWRAYLEREWAFLSASLLLFLLTAGITMYWCRSMPSGMPMPAGWTMSMAWMRTAGQGWFVAALSFEAMWIVMMMAMILPSLAVTLLGYGHAIRDTAHAHLNQVTLIVATFFVWATFRVAIYPLGTSLSRAEMTWPTFARVVPQATGLVLLLAGIFELRR